MNRVTRTRRRKQEPSTLRSPQSGARPRFALPVVLVVDDTEDNRDLYSMLLARLGFAVELAVDGRDGVERALEVLPSVILMDLAMPNVDGFEATRRIRAIPKLASVHIIAISAMTDSVSVQRALAAGCNEVLAKPCPPSLLIERVEAGARDRLRSREIA